MKRIDRFANQSALGRLVWIVLVCIALYASSLQAEPRTVEIRALDGLALQADYYPSPKQRPGILLLHQCNRDRTSLTRLAEDLNADDFHVLSLDFRGFGGSRDDDNESFQQDFDRLWPKFASDIDGALSYMSTLPGIEASRLGILGVSCGGSQALLASQRNQRVRAVVIVSLNLAGVPDDARRQLRVDFDTPVFSIVAIDDPRPALETRRLFDGSLNRRSRMLTLKGEAHGSALINREPSLSRQISDWFREELSPRATP